MHPELRWAIYARDAGVCGICGDPVHPDDLDIDHVIHRVAGGSDDPANLRVTHAACNRKRGARGVPGAYMGAFKSTWGDQRVVNLRIRFPVGFADRVQSFADTDRRSLNSEVLTLLEEAMNARQSTGSRTLRCADPPAPYDTSPPSSSE